MGKTYDRMDIPTAVRMKCSEGAVTAALKIANQHPPILGCWWEGYDPDHSKSGNRVMLEINAGMGRRTYRIDPDGSATIVEYATYNE